MLKEMERSSICTVQLLETCISIQKILIDRSYKQPQQQEKNCSNYFLCVYMLFAMYDTLQTLSSRGGISFPNFKSRLTLKLALGTERRRQNSRPKPQETFQASSAPM